MNKDSLLGYGISMKTSLLNKFRNIGLILFFVLFVSPTALAASWSTMTTPHFLITFEEGQESIAQQAAFYLEKSYEALTVQLGHEPKDKTRVLLADTSDLANGFATSHWGYNMEHFWLVYGGPNKTLRAGIDTWLYTLAIHELTHTIHIDMNNGLAKGLRSVFGRMGRPTGLFVPPVLFSDLTSPNGDLPVFLVEGFASYMETINTEGGRLGGSLWEMMLRADFVNKRVMTRDQASGRYDPYSRYVGDAPYYMYGAYFCAYIADTYGQDKLFEIMERNSGRDASSIGGTFKKVLEVGVADVWKDFIAASEAIYLAQAAEVESQGLTESTRLSRTAETAGLPLYSPDGEQIAYAQSGRNNAAAIRVMSSDGKRNRTLVTTDLVHTGDGFSWSPDGTQIAFSKLESFDGRQVNDLYIKNLDSGKTTRLTEGLRASGPTWSPDGTQIIFVAKTGSLQTSLMSMRLNDDSTELAELVPGENEMQFSTPRFSPDGNQIAVAVGQFGGFEDIYLVDANNGQMRALTQDRDHDFSPSWSPDGQYVLFNSDRSGVNNIYAYQLPNNTLMQVTNVIFGAFSPTMSPDGSQIAFVNYDINGYDIHVIEVDQSGWRSVNMQRENLPQSPDYVAFTQEFEINGYSAFDTLRPHAWQPQVAGIIGARIMAQDLMGHTTYSLIGGMAYNGAPFAQLDIQHKISDIPVTPFDPQPLTLNLSANLGSVGGGLTLPLMQTRNLSQSIGLTGNAGILGVEQTPQGPVLISGFSVGGAWGLQGTNATDGLRTSYQLALNGSYFSTDFGDGLSVGAQGGLSLTFASDTNLSAFASLSPQQGTGNVSLTVPLFSPEVHFGTLPIYFSRVHAQGFVGAATFPQGSFTQYGGSLIFTVYLWHNIPITPNLGVIMVNGQLLPTFGLGF